MKRKNARSRFTSLTYSLVGTLLLWAGQSHAAQPPDNSAAAVATNAAPSAADLAEFEDAHRNFRNFRVESAEEFVRIKQHHNQLLNEGKRVHRFKTADGQLIHCIEIGSQSSLKRAGINAKDVRSAPEVPPVDNGPQKAALANPADFGMDGTSDTDGNVRLCPAGAIPVLIPSLEDLCRFKKLDHRMRKFPSNRDGNGEIVAHRPPGETASKAPIQVAPPGSDAIPGFEPPAGHEYAHAYTWVDNQGEQADFNVWQPYVQRTDEFSLSQLWVVRGSGSDRQTVEFGWQAYYDLYGDWSPHLFIYFTTHNYDSSYAGGYNLSASGFVQTDSSIVIGGRLSPVSASGGGQYQSTLLVYRDQGGAHNWWLKYGGTWIGYYPNNLFDTAGLADKGEIIDYGGEIVNQNINTAHTATDMGSGRYPRDGYSYAAYIKHIQYVDMNNYYHQADSLNRSVSGACFYDLAQFYSSDPNWLYYFYFGGPGAGGYIQNDTCYSAIALADSVYFAESTTCANDDAVPCLGINYKAGWFTFRPTIAGIATVDTCGSDFDTKLEVLSGSCGAFASLGCNDDACGLQSRVSFPCTAGVTYYICAGGYGGASGNLHIRAHAAPVNDQCTGGIALNNGITYTMNTAAADATGDPTPTCGYGVTKGVWFTFTPASSGPVGISTCGSDFDTVLQVYSGSCSALTPVTCDDDYGPYCSSYQASVQFNANGGTTYFVFAGGYGGGSGNLSMTAYYPANDNCSGAMRLSAGVPYSMNTAAATGTGDPTPVCGYGLTKGVWFSFTPIVNAPVTISTCGSSFDTVLQVYTGTCGALTPVTCDDDYGPSCAGLQASVQFMGSAYQTYLIFTGGFGGSSGNLNIVANSAPLAMGRMAFQNGQPQCTINGPAGASCVIEASSDLVHWVELGTYTILPNGALTINDPNSANYSSRFYRSMIRDSR